MTGAATGKRTMRAPRLVFGLLLAAQGLLLRVAAPAPDLSAAGAILPGPFVQRALNLSSWVFLIAAAATLMEANAGQERGGSWRSLGTLVLGLMAAANLMAGACLTQSRPAMAHLLRVLGLPLALAGVAMGLIALRETRLGSERLASLAGLLLNALVFSLGVAAALRLRGLR